MLNGITTQAPPPEFPIIGTIRKGEERVGKNAPSNLDQLFRIVTPIKAVAEIIANRYQGQEKPVAGKSKHPGVAVVGGGDSAEEDFSDEDGNLYHLDQSGKQYTVYVDMLHVIFPYKDYTVNGQVMVSALERNLWAWATEFNSQNRMQVQCDMNRIVKKRDPSGVLIDCDEPCRSASPGHRICDKCRASQKLFVVIPEVWAAGYTGVLQVRSTSINDARNIASFLRLLQEYEGQMDGIICEMTRKFTYINTPFNKKEEWLIHLATVDSRSRTVAMLPPTSQQGRLVGPSTTTATVLAPPPPIQEEAQPLPNDVQFALDMQAPLEIKAETEVDDTAGLLPGSRPLFETEAFKKLIPELKDVGMTPVEAANWLVKYGPVNGLSVNDKFTDRATARTVLICGFAQALFQVNMWTNNHYTNKFHFINRIKAFCAEHYSGNNVIPEGNPLWRKLIESVLEEYGTEAPLPPDKVIVPQSTEREPAQQTKAEIAFRSQVKATAASEAKDFDW